jgi:Arc/MetJ family transcription regulator
MATNLALDDRLIMDALKLGGHKTKREAVTAALEAYIKAKRRVGILEMFGKVDFDPAWDYKAARRRGNKRIPKGRA